MRSRRNPWTREGWIGAEVVIMDPEGSVVWDFASGVLDAHDPEFVSLEQAEESLMRALRMALEHGVAEPGDVAEIRIGDRRERRRIVRAGDGSLALDGDEVLANPSVSCPSCGAGVKDTAEACWKCRFDLKPSRRTAPTFGRVLRGRLGVAANPRWLDYEGAPAETRERLRRLAEKKISRHDRRAGVKSPVDPEDVVQAAMLAELEARRKRHSHPKTAPYRAMDEEISRSASIAETPAKILKDALAALARGPVRRGPERASARGVARTLRRTPLGESLPAPESEAPDYFLLERVKNAVDMLGFREREVIKLAYGLADGQTYTREEIGRIFRVTRERVRQIEAEALSKLKDSLGLVLRNRPRR